jgi:serine phosphatase RsbU (regulator of sigma subunit)
MNGDVLGLFDQVHICQRSVEANAGDRFLLYSDGLIDNAAQNMNREKGLEALLRICNHLAQETDIQNFVQGVVQELASQRQQDVADDIVALGVEV